MSSTKALRSSRCAASAIRIRPEELTAKEDAGLSEALLPEENAMDEYATATMRATATKNLKYSLPFFELISRLIIYEHLFSQTH